jgi:hypothetical protein
VRVRADFIQFFSFFLLVTDRMIDRLEARSRLSCVPARECHGVTLAASLPGNRFSIFSMEFVDQEFVLDINVYNLDASPIEFRASSWLRCQEIAETLHVS